MVELSIARVGDPKPGIIVIVIDLRISRLIHFSKAWNRHFEIWLILSQL